MTDDLRPRGTVQVPCSHPECHWQFWVGALDPRLPDGPFWCQEHDPDQTNWTPSQPSKGPTDVTHVSALVLQWRKDASSLRREVATSTPLRQSNESKEARADVLEVVAGQLERVLAERLATVASVAAWLRGDGERPALGSTQPRDLPLITCGGCSAKLYPDGGVCDPVCQWCKVCGTASLREVCDRCATKQSPTTQEGIRALSLAETKSAAADVVVEDAESRRAAAETKLIAAEHRIEILERESAKLRAEAATMRSACCSCAIRCARCGRDLSQEEPEKRVEKAVTAEHTALAELVAAIMAPDAFPVDVAEGEVPGKLVENPRITAALRAARTLLRSGEPRQAGQ